MRVVWDPKKSAANAKKHRILFVDAATVLDDPLALTIPDERHDEQRFATLGSDHYARLLVVIYTYDGVGDIRLISARKATRRERRKYENDAR